MRERLREVAEQPLSRRVVLLREQAEVVARSRAAARTAPAPRRRAPRISSASTSQNEHGRKTPSPPGSPSTSLCSFGRVALDEAVARQVALDRVDRADHARVVRRQEPDERDQQRRRVELVGAVGLRERVELDVERLAAHLLVDLVPHPAPALDRARRGRTARPSATARSNATHASTFECVKWRRGPRTSQIPSSGSSHAPSRNSIRLRCSDHAWSSAGEAVRCAPGAARPSPRRTRRAGTARARRSRSRTGLRARIARQPVELGLRDAPLAADAVEDLRVRRVAGDRAQQPVAPRARPRR